jgi:cell division protein ZapE
VDTTAPARLADRIPEVDAGRMAASLVPPRQFTRAGLDNYRPDPDYPSQQAAVDAVGAFTADWTSPPGGFFRRGPKPPERPGLYLDGGFGVGKTHLLAALWRQAPGRKYFGTFIEYTALVGALGYAEAVRLLTGSTLLAIDEFELDDPGDTVLVSTLLTRLREAGVRLAATSNTLPGRLGEGRFATDDFLREIQGLSAHFESVRIDGDDYRHRGLPETPPAPDLDTVKRAADLEGASLDHFVDLSRHLAQVHPSKYGALLDGVRLVCLEDVRTVDDQAVALRLVVLADRMYDRDLPVVASGVTFDRLFAPPLLQGGYRKKYHRAVSRLVALAREGAELVRA